MGFVQFDPPPTAAVLGELLSSGPLDENPPHCLGGGEEMPSAIELLITD